MSTHLNFVRLKTKKMNLYNSIQERVRSFMNLNLPTTQQK